ncbi:MAG: twin-arginine translocase TatA/TatE family subunit [Armatimonadetes bacterium]|nr:twin-arginine translocase TatA/TatE family subunit [Armatimonadota bacterium]
MQTLAFLQGQEIWIVAIVILLLFGGKKIPELMRGVGKGVGELQSGIEEGKKNFEDAKRSTRDAIEAKPKTDSAEPAKIED